MYPGFGWRPWRNRIKLGTRLLLGYSRTLAWWRFLDQPALQPIAQQHGTLFEAIHRPYLHRNWSGKQRYRALLGHYCLLGSLSELRLYDAHRHPVSLFSGEFGGRRLELALHKDQRFCREGELAMSLFVDGQRRLSLAFILAEQEGRRALYVGCLQGSRGDGCRETLAECTRAMHGLRPRDLLLWALRLLGEAIHAQDIYAISHRFQQYSSAHYIFGGGKKIQADYDTAWTEAGGLLLPTGFFHLPVKVQERCLSEVKSSKRAMYRRRYEMLEAMRHDFLAKLHRGQPGEVVIEAPCATAHSFPIKPVAPVSAIIAPF